MNTRITRTLTLIVAIFTIAHIFAAEPVRIKGPAKTSQERSLHRALSKHLSFPLLDREDMTGEVFVSFVVDKEGKIEVLDCNSTNARLKDYVMRKLARIDIGDNPNGFWKTTHLRISFKPERT